ncbi:MAG: acyl-CoA synthetase [Ilumatobacteraceae bacterium]|nr:acyl-CoA synthetase [Ilumatobacteraceae bacterium]
METPATIASQLRARIGDDHLGYVLDEQRYSWHQVAQQSVIRASMLKSLLQNSPPHIGVLLENTPEYLFLAGGASFIGAAIVGINPTRRGAELARDIRHTNCQIIITDSAQQELLTDLDLGDVHTTLLVDSTEYVTLIAQHSDALMQHASQDPSPSTPLFLLFTSGSTSAPKAVVCSTTRMAMSGIRASEITGVTRNDVCYSPMPLFHGNALMANWSSALAHGATFVMRRKFSATKFLDDVRQHNCTFFTYVGRTIAYILAQPETQYDKQHKLRHAFGTEASALDRELFEKRFGCRLIEGYGSSESVIVISLTPDSPLGSLGRPRNPADDIAVVNPDTGQECVAAKFTEHGAIINPTEAIGELVNRNGGGAFEGYYNNDSATDARLRRGWYWSGDLAYRDADGFFYFAGRDADWLRVDSENFATAPVEEILRRFAGVVMVAAYPVPDPRTGDQVMVTLEMTPGSIFDPVSFDTFLSSQRDLGTKWAPRFVRITTSIPLTANNKVNKTPLRSEAWITPDQVWWRTTKDAALEPLTLLLVVTLHQEFHQNQRTAFLPVGAPA